MKKVLVLGAGLVAKPLIRYLLDKGYEVTCATRTVAKADKLLDKHPNGRAVALKIEDEAALSALVKKTDLAVSLVPYAYHPVVAKHCIANKKHMVTTSYVSPAMQEQAGAAKAAEVTILNEIGVDPGIDHMSAMRIIDGVRKRGGKIVAFRSYCGGLPAPEANDNPFGYKFSWAPRGVLLAGRNSAQWIEDGRKVVVPSENLFRAMHILNVEEAGFFEAYPNRDSVSYLDVYGLQGISTLFRGTLRNMGWCDTLYSIRKLGLLELDELNVKGKTYAWVMRKVLNVSPKADLVEATAKKLGVPKLASPIQNLKWLGMFSNQKVKSAKSSTLDVLGELMFKKLQMKAGERDMIVLFHDFRAEFPGGKRERLTSSLIDFGIKNGDSSMARTVSLPAAIAVNMILQGRFTATGVLRPVTPDIYNPVLDELRSMKIECKEHTEAI